MQKNDGPFQFLDECINGRRWTDRNTSSPYFGIYKEEMIPYKNEEDTYKPVKRYISASKVSNCYSPLVSFLIGLQELVELRVSLRSWVTEHCNVTDGVKCQIRLDDKVIWERFAPRYYFNFEMI